jgi:hypothetical protein
MFKIPHSILGWGIFCPAPENFLFTQPVQIPSSLPNISNLIQISQNQRCNQFSLKRIHRQFTKLTPHSSNCGLANLILIGIAGSNPTAIQNGVSSLHGIPTPTLPPHPKITHNNQNSATFSNPTKSPTYPAATLTQKAYGQTSPPSSSSTSPNPGLSNAPAPSASSPSSTAASTIPPPWSDRYSRPTGSGKKANPEQKSLFTARI